MRSPNLDLCRPGLHPRPQRWRGGAYSCPQGSVRELRSFPFSPALTLGVFFRYREFYPNGTTEPGNIARLPNHGSFDRVKKLLDTTKGTVILGGDTDRETKYVAPTIVRNVDSDDSLMVE